MTVCLSVCLCLCMSVCVCMCGCLSVCVCLYVCLAGCLYMSVCICVCLCLSVCVCVCLYLCLYLSGERDVAQSIACPPLKRSVVGSILLSGPSCSLGYFPFQPVVHNWFIKGRGMYCSVYGKVHIKDPLLLIDKSSLCGGSGFPSKKCVNVTI